MRTAIGFALVLSLAAAAAGCRSRAPKEDPGPGRSVQDYRVIWTRGGKLGYLQTDLVSRPNEPKVRLHYVLDLDFRERGWVADDGQAERFEYPPSRVAEAQRAPFERVALPVDSLEAQIRRILQVDMRTEIALQHATEADLKR